MKRSIGFGALALASILGLGLLLPGAGPGGLPVGPPPDYCDRCVNDGFGCCSRSRRASASTRSARAPTADGSAAVLLAAIFRPADPAAANAGRTDAGRENPPRPAPRHLPAERGSARSRPATRRARCRRARPLNSTTGTGSVLVSKTADVSPTRSSRSACSLSARDLAQRFESGLHEPAAGSTPRSLAASRSNFPSAGRRRRPGRPSARDQLADQVETDPAAADVRPRRSGFASRLTACTTRSFSG